MELTLLYTGPLKSNTNAKEKQRIRSEFHRQLEELWKLFPFKPDPHSFYKKVGAFNFLPLVVEGRNEVAEINIIMLRPEPQGFIVGEGGDIDNRIKTLLDSLRMPKNDQEIPRGTAPTCEQNPFYCLLEDDKLITKLSISTDRLLIPKTQNDVFLLINVRIKRVGPAFGHMMMGV